MLKKFKLRTILLLLAVVGICLPAAVISLTLTQQYEQRMLEDYIAYVDNELARIAGSIDSYLQANILSFSEAGLYDQQLNELLNQELPLPENAEEQQWEYMVREYMLNRHLEQMANYGIGSMRLALLVNQAQQCFNLKYPINVVGPQTPFLQTILAGETERTLQFNWYPLQADPFGAPTGDLRENLVVPVTRNIISPLSQKYYGKQVFLIPEKELYELYSVSQLSSNSKISVLDTQGELVSCSDLNALRTGQTASALLGVDEERGVYTAEETIETNGWTLLCEASLASIYEDVHRKIWQDAVWIVGLLLLICGVVMWASDRITAPLYTLMASMNKASHKDFSNRVEEQGTKDILHLIHNYNSLLADVDDMIYREYEVSRQKQQAEMDALVTQINPHFLYNTLESIVWQARGAGVPQVADMAHYLGELFNLTINKGKPMMTIEKELSHVQMYVNLQNMRYNDRIHLQVSWDDEALLERETLKLILQPVVENSILHGLPPDGGPITIYLHVEADEEKIVFYIEDDGNGIEPEQLERLNKKLADPAIMYDVKRAEREKRHGNGIGIVNVHQRLRLYYGNQYGVKIQSTLGEGTCTEIYIPNKK